MLQCCMGIQLIVTDLDGTLVDGTSQYEEARHNIFAHIVSEGYSPEQAQEHRDRWDIVDKEFFPQQGIWGRRFGVSAATAYYEMGWATPDYRLMEEIYEIGCAFSDVETQPIPSMINALKFAQESGIDVIVYTRGDDRVQHPKLVTLNKLGFHPTRFVSVPAKSHKDFAEFASFHASAPSACMTVGDSLSSDVKPALDVDYGVGIHIAGAGTWAPLETHVGDHQATVVQTHDEAAELIKNLIS